MADKGCSFEGCDKSHYAKGLCSTHYKRYQRQGDPAVIGKSGRPRKQK